MGMVDSHPDFDRSSEVPGGSSASKMVLMDTYTRGFFTSMEFSMGGDFIRAIYKSVGIEGLKDLSLSDSNTYILGLGLILLGDSVRRVIKVREEFR